MGEELNARLTQNNQHEGRTAARTAHISLRFHFKYLRDKIILESPESISWLGEQTNKQTNKVFPEFQGLSHLRETVEKVFRASDHISCV